MKAGFVMNLICVITLVISINRSGWKIDTFIYHLSFAAMGCLCLGLVSSQSGQRRLAGTPTARYWCAPYSPWPTARCSRSAVDGNMVVKT
jgi:hypothetical protein